MTEYGRKDIKTYAEERLGLEHCKVSTDYEGVENREGYTDHVWTVTDKDNQLEESGFENLDISYNIIYEHPYRNIGDYEETSGDASSYDFNDYPYERDGEKQYGYYYKKDGEKTPMEAYFYTHFRPYQIEPMTGLKVVYN